jgi:hypothetical protein
MARTKKGEAAKKWSGHLEAWDTSGVSLSAFAKREGLNVRSLYRWKTVLRGTAAVATSFAPIVVTGAAEARRDGFELVVCDGMSLRIPGDFDEATLARIVRALGASR